MTQKLTGVGILPETKELANKIAQVTREKKFMIYDRAIREYAEKKLNSTTN